VSYSITLVPPNFLERIEAHDSCLVEAFDPKLVKSIGDSKEFLDFFVELTERFTSFQKDCLEILPVFPRKKGAEESLESLEFAMFIPEHSSDNDESKQSKTENSGENPRG
jgi:hypothetical protein